MERVSRKLADVVDVVGYNFQRNFAARIFTLDPADLEIGIKWDHAHHPISFDDAFDNVI